MLVIESVLFIDVSFSVDDQCVYTVLNFLQRYNHVDVGKGLCEIHTIGTEP